MHPDLHAIEQSAVLVLLLLERGQDDIIVVICYTASTGSAILVYCCTCSSAAGVRVRTAGGGGGSPWSGHDFMCIPAGAGAGTALNARQMLIALGDAACTCKSCVDWLHVKAAAPARCTPAHKVAAD